MKVGMVNVDICVSSFLKEELAWAADKWIPKNAREFLI